MQTALHLFIQPLEGCGKLRAVKQSCHSSAPKDDLTSKFAVSCTRVIDMGVSCLLGLGFNTLIIHFCASLTSPVFLNSADENFGGSKSCAALMRPAGGGSGCRRGGVGDSVDVEVVGERVDVEVVR